MDLIINEIRGNVYKIIPHIREILKQKGIEEGFSKQDFQYEMSRLTGWKPTTTGRWFERFIDLGYIKYHPEHGYMIVPDFEKPYKFNTGEKD